MRLSRLERSLGINVYATGQSGIGGVIKQLPEDFKVEEVLVDGSRARIDFAGTSQAKRTAPGISDGKGRHLLCVLIKRSWDNLSALKAISNKLGTNAASIQIAGIKDARAVTAQHVTIEGTSTEEIQNVSIKDIRIYPIGYCHRKLSSHYLLGNQFSITIRRLSRPRSGIEERITKTTCELEDSGIPNFFGHQRFGTIRPITHLIGKALIQGEPKKAAMLFLAKPSFYEHLNSRIAREQLQENQDFQKALKEFPRQLRYECLMLTHLAKRPYDFVGAFRRLPTRLVGLFTQAYQSYLFNRFLSDRMTMRLPLHRVVDGDYSVCVDRLGLPISRFGPTARVEDVPELNREISSGKRRLALPIIGFRQRQSKGVQGGIEQRILEEEDVAMDCFKVRAIPEARARGGLRVASFQLKDFQLKGIYRDTECRKHSVQVSFMLQRGSYATIVLRELMKPQNLVKSGF